jgi:hypothetical protein
MKANLLFILIFLFLSCCDDDNCIKRIGMINISETMIPDTVMNFDNIQIVAEAEATSGCWSDLYIELNETGKLEYSIKAFGTYKSCGICPCIMVYKYTAINFQPTQKGVHLFKIYQLPNRIIVDTMIVE